MRSGPSSLRRASGRRPMPNTNSSAGLIPDGMSLICRWWNFGPPNPPCVRLLLHWRKLMPAELRQWDYVYGVFAPKRTDTLRPEWREEIGKRFRWRVGWTNGGDESNYPGETVLF